VNAAGEWTERPFGRRKILSEEGKNRRLVVQIDPQKNTGIGADKSSADQSGLVGHPGIRYEHIEHQGFVGDQNGLEPSLKYAARGTDAADSRSFLFSKGSEFYSVQTDESKFGYWHVLYNVSDRPIQLLIRVVKE
jgi:hypothetical protein